MPDDAEMIETMRAILAEPLSVEERDLYARPGTLLRQVLDEGVLPWPTRFQAMVELADAEG
jgi:hypothetical protein